MQTHPANYFFSDINKILQTVGLTHRGQKRSCDMFGIFLFAFIFLFKFSRAYYYLFKSNFKPVYQ